MGCPPVRGDNPRALASGLSPRTGGQPMVKLYYTTYISVDLAYQMIFHAKVGKGGIIIKPAPTHELRGTSHRKEQY